MNNKAKPTGKGQKTGQPPNKGQKTAPPPGKVKKTEPVAKVQAEAEAPQTGEMAGETSEPAPVEIHLSPEELAEYEQLEKEIHKKQLEIARRRDLLAKPVLFASLTCWGLFVATLVLLQQASPELDNVFSAHLELELRHTWDKDLLARAFQLMHYVAGSTLLVLGLEVARFRQHVTRYPISIILLFFAAVGGISFLDGKF